MSIGIWKDQGTVIAAVSSDTPGQPNVLYESGAVILSGTVFKMWFGTANGVCYAESTDGLSWTRYSSNPIIPIASLGTNTYDQTYPKVVKIGSTYYMYVNNGASDIQLWTSTDGITFAQINAHAVAYNTQGWETSWFGQLGVVPVPVAGTYYGYYQAYNSATSSYEVGQATSTDLIHWTKNAANPVLTQPPNPCFAQVGSEWYMWGQIIQPGIPAYGALSLPSDIGRFSASSPAGPWTSLLPASTFFRTIVAEGVGTDVGQVADPTMAAANGNIYMYFTQLPIGWTGANQQVGCAIATGVTFSQLTQTLEGNFDIPQPSSYGFANQLNTLASDNFQRADANPIGGNWTQLYTGAGFAAGQLASHFYEASATSNNCDSYWNAITWPNDQWVSITIATLGSGCYAGIDLRTTPGAFATATGYRLAIEGPTGATAKWEIIKYVNGTSTNIDPGGSQITFTLAANDVMTMAVVGTQISLYQNANLLYTVTDSSIASGDAGILAYAVTSVANSQISAFSGGSFLYSISGNAGVSGATISYTGPSSGSVTTDASGNYSINSLVPGTYTVTPSLTGYTFSPTSASETVSGSNITGVNFTASAASGAYSVPDCRVTKPNSATGETINGTILYDSQTSSNPAIPPTDSRVSKPVACGTYPQNSRTPGTYGPGE